MSRVGILGAGTWGTALARLLANAGHDVTVWSSSPERAARLSAERTHPGLPDTAIPASIRFTSSLPDACGGREMIVFAVPSVRVRSTAALARACIPDESLVVSVAKGIEPGTLRTMTQVIGDELSRDGAHGGVRLVALSGPTHAEEVARDLPTTIVAACADMTAAAAVQDIFMTDEFRVYTNFDVTGVELCGAVKNIIALAAGIAEGLGCGDNTKAALITRGMAEITRLGTAMGCSARTFSGLAGMGDLIVTATSRHSRNNRCGLLIGRGMAPADAVNAIGMVVESMNALPAVLALAARYKTDLPIVSAVGDIVLNGEAPADVVRRLMGRSKTSESTGSALELSYENAILESKRGMGMKRVITYGTFDLLHYGHINLLRRAKALGDYLVVALSTDEFNWNEKRKKCYFTYEQRKSLLESIRYVDLVIPEENWEQKRTDAHEYHIDTFVMGDDWTGKFDFLRDEGVEVVYLPRTPEISTTQIKQDLHQK